MIDALQSGGSGGFFSFHSPLLRTSLIFFLTSRNGINRLRHDHHLRHAHDNNGHRLKAQRRAPLISLPASGATAQRKE